LMDGMAFRRDAIDRVSETQICHTTPGIATQIHKNGMPIPESYHKNAMV